MLDYVCIINFLIIKAIWHNSTILPQYHKTLNWHTQPAWPVVGVTIADV